VHDVARKSYVVDEVEAFAGEDDGLAGVAGPGRLPISLRFMPEILLELLFAAMPLAAEILTMARPS
jgi:hypothetical protein